MTVVDIVRRIPGARAAYRWLMRAFAAQPRFPGSRIYWDARYAAGGTSGSGSYGSQAEFKARVINAFVENEGVSSVIEFGCGDGNQLSLAKYPNYLGFDVSETAVRQCKRRFQEDVAKDFRHTDVYAGETADLALSLDVIYHLVEDEVFHDYMSRVFSAARRFVIIYSTNEDESALALAPHVRHRRFTDWTNRHQPSWERIALLPNTLPADTTAGTGPRADFHIYKRVAPGSRRQTATTSGVSGGVQLSWPTA